MTSTVQEVLRVSNALDHLEPRMEKCYKYLLHIAAGNHPPDAMSRIAVAKGEVDTIEALIRRLARYVTGSDPDEAEWEPRHQYCLRNEVQGNGDWAEIWAHPVSACETYLLETSKRLEEKGYMRLSPGRFVY